MRTIAHRSLCPLVAVLGLAGILLSCQVQAVPPPAADAPKAVVRLLSHGASATVIHTEEKRTFLLGCAHAFEGADRTKPIRLDGPAAPMGRAVLVAVDYRADLSLLVVHAGPVPHCAPVASLSFRPGPSLLSVGYDDMRMPAAVRGATIVASTRDLTYTREKPWHGRSGGALLDRQSGYLIGVVQGYEAIPGGRGMYVAHAAICRFLQAQGWRGDPPPEKPRRVPQPCPSFR